MLRLSSFLLGLALISPGLAQSVAVPDAAEDAASITAKEDLEDRVWHSLRLGDLMPILRDEALDQAVLMEEVMFEKGGDGGWLQQVERIHTPDRMEAMFRTGLDSAMSDAPADEIGAALDFYEGGLGQQILSLETSARQVMIDDTAELAARDAFARADLREAPRVGQIDRLIEAADLVGPNVAGGLNAALAFSRGFEQGGGYQVPMTEAQMLEDTWAQEPEIREETLGWMKAYLFLAYSPLSDAELERYITFAASPEGQALSKVMFAGFDALFVQTSREMGQAAALQLKGREL